MGLHPCPTRRSAPATWHLSALSARHPGSPASGHTQLPAGLLPVAPAARGRESPSSALSARCRNQHGAPRLWCSAPSLHSQLPQTLAVTTEPRVSPPTPRPFTHAIPAGPPQPRRTTRRETGDCVQAGGLRKAQGHCCGDMHAEGFRAGFRGTHILSPGAVENGYAPLSPQPSAPPGVQKALKCHQESSL